MADIFTRAGYAPNSRRGLKMMELFAGIGGMRTAALEAGLELDSVHPYEINPSALLAYCHNFSDQEETKVILPKVGCLYKHKPNSKRSTSPKPRNLLGLTADEWHAVSPDLLTMSPPCQPFTRQGLQLDTSDPRSEPLQHVLTLLQTVRELPAMLLLENVKGFETSSSRNLVTRALRNRGYLFQEFLLCPSQLGVPNSRLRYYLLAILSPDTNQTDQAGSHESLTTESCHIQRKFPVCLCFGQNLKASNYVNKAQECQTCHRIIIHDILSLLSRFHFPSYVSPDKFPCNQSESAGETETFADVTPPIAKFLEKEIFSSPLGSSLQPDNQGNILIKSNPNKTVINSTQNDQLDQIIHDDVQKFSECHRPVLEGGSLTLLNSNSGEQASERLVCPIYATPGNDGSNVTPGPSVEDNSTLMKNMSQFELKPKILVRYAMLLDIVDDTSQRSCCFTKAYGRLVEGTGSVFNPSGRAALDAAFETWRSSKCNNEIVTETKGSITEQNNEGRRPLEPLLDHLSDDEISELNNPLLPLKLRFFSPSECLRLMCFPSSFSFPASLTTRQQYQLIGNSVNVLVVTVLLKYLRYWHLNGDIKQDRP
ncbi:tRNA (cytosine(38)-C(5))-methyltransferase [Hyalella azteca]|uniref:tRNA (cytosine(38)-C(5))-methyltransferase n=1 Tax=Hyalella azteca TaxID=294128 RepID=A0A8B7PLJ3_HYAAZ|nr:tRNA (cytosine(38)-C(5))-methyltransferase [Hyalella azteca]XP_018026278.1 tRNA (cytosine(38)-C(5))-methyltransferase [Hyalella azteca]